METSDLLLLAGVGAVAYLLYEKAGGATATTVASTAATAPATSSTVATANGVTNLPTMPTGNPGLNTSFAPASSLSSTPALPSPHVSSSAAAPASVPSYNVGQPGRLNVQGYTLNPPKFP